MQEIFDRFDASIEIERAKIERCLKTIAKLNTLMYLELKTYHEKEDSQEEDQEVQQG